MHVGYRGLNPYHNHIHAADVTHAAYWIITTGGLSAKITNFTQQDFFSLLFSAAIHDYDHPYDQ